MNGHLSCCGSSGGARCSVGHERSSLWTLPFWRACHDQRVIRRRAATATPPPTKDHTHQGRVSPNHMMTPTCHTSRSGSCQVGPLGMDSRWGNLFNRGWGDLVFWCVVLSPPAPKWPLVPALSRCHPSSGAPGCLQPPPSFAVGSPPHTHLFPQLARASTDPKQTHHGRPPPPQAVFNGSRAVGAGPTATQRKRLRGGWRRATRGTRSTASRRGRRCTSAAAAASRSPASGTTPACRPCHCLDLSVC